MNKYRSPAEFRDAIAKNSGIAPKKIAMYDNFGNDLEKVIPVYSPTLAYLLSAIHKQDVVEVVDFDDTAFVTFKPDKVVSEAIQLWQTIIAKYKNGENMPVQILMGEYINQQVSKKSMQKIEQFSDMYSKHVEEHLKTCKKCSDVNVQSKQQ
jgi:hypothetical protein